jgi:hypothetical protein
MSMSDTSIRPVSGESRPSNHKAGCRAQLRVPHAGAADRDPVDGDVPVEAEHASGDPDFLALPASVVAAVAGGGAVLGDGHGVRGPLGGIRDLLEVGEVDRGRRAAAVELQAHLRAGAERAAEQRADLVVEVVRLAVAGPVRERVGAVVPSVPAVLLGPITEPFVLAFSASCSANGTVAPRPSICSADSTASCAGAASSTTTAARTQVSYQVAQISDSSAIVP